MADEMTAALLASPSLRTWYRATRPRTLAAAIVPVLAGSALALSDRFSILRFLLALAGSVAIQAGTNMLNEHFDHVQGLDLTRVKRQDMVIQTGELRHDAMLRGGTAAMVIGAICGLVLVYQTGPGLLVLGVLSILAGYAYTARPIALGYRALGEVTVFFFMGPAIVAGSYYVQTGIWSGRALLLSLPIGMIVTSILHVNNVRDMADDRANGKRTLANLLGRRVAEYEYFLLVPGAYAVLCLLVAAGALPVPALLALLTFPVAMRLSRQLSRASAVLPLDRVMAATARLHMRFGLLLTAGLAIEAVRKAMA